MANGLLIRVAIDLTSGAGTRPFSGRNFCYVPWAFPIDRRFDRVYAPYRKAVERLLPPSALLRFGGRVADRGKHISIRTSSTLPRVTEAPRAARIKDVLSRGATISMFFTLASILSKPQNSFTQLSAFCY